jgi:hypothetical protein
MKVGILLAVGKNAGDVSMACHEGGRGQEC